MASEVGNTLRAALSGTKFQATGSDPAAAAAAPALLNASTTVAVATSVQPVATSCDVAQALARDAGFLNAPQRQFLTPRGRYDVVLLEDEVRLFGAKETLQIKRDNVRHVFRVGSPAATAKGAAALYAFVLDVPIVIGKSTHPVVVMQEVGTPAAP
jgi:hypothetical protein